MSLTRLKNIITSRTGRIIYVNPDDFDASDAKKRLYKTSLTDKSEYHNTLKYQIKLTKSKLSND